LSGALEKKRKSQMSDDERVRSFQRKLYQKSKQEETFRFYVLYDKLCLPYVLREAYKRCRKNGGSPGVDGVTFASIEDAGVDGFLERIRNELEQETYRPEMVRRVYIPKANGKMRPLGIPTIKDRVVQTACKLVIEPIFEADFQDESYGFRPRRSAGQAVATIREHLKRGYDQVYDADLSSYFDTIPHDKLMKLLEQRITDKRVLKLIRMWLKTPVRDDDGTISGGRNSREGTPQGGVISPLLANIYLNILDKAVNRNNGIYWYHNIKIVRYADDFILMGRYMPDTIVRYTIGLLERLGLTINTEKSRRIQARKNPFDFLGFTFRHDRDKFGRPFKFWNVTPSVKAEKRLYDNARELLDTHRHWGPQTVSRELNKRISGWFGYYTIPGVSYPMTTAYRMEEKLSYKLHKYYKRKSQVCRVCPGTVDEAVSLPGLPCGSYLQAEQFLPGMQYPVQTQKSSLEAKLAGKPFLQAVPRQIQQHWWKAFLIAAGRPATGVTH
jgi:RNA-directed DNA polymerase